MDKEGRILKINEDVYDEVIGDFLTEGLVPERGKVLAIVDILKELGIIKIKTSDISSNGFPVSVKSMALADENGEILKELSKDDVVSMLDSIKKVRSMILDNADRRKFLDAVVEYWYDGKIKKNGLLPTNFIK